MLGRPFRIGGLSPRSATATATEPAVVPAPMLGYRRKTSWPRLEDEVERRLSGTPHLREPCLVKHVGEPRFPGLGAQGHSDVLGSGGRRADQGRHREEDAPHLPHIFGETVLGIRLHQQEYAV